MYLHTRLLLGILAVTLFALLVSVLVPLASLRQDVSRETEASMQLSGLLLDVEAGIRASDSAAAATAGAAQKVRTARHLRHVSVTLTDQTGAPLAATPHETPAIGWLERLLLPQGGERSLSYPLLYGGQVLGALRVRSNPLSEFEELTDRVASDIALLAVAILVMAVSIYWMVRRGLRPVGAIKAALTHLAAGELDTRLPHYRLKDLDEIGDRFNHCASALQEAAASRRELTRRLIGVEEEERTRLARELHDELGQTLTAIKVDAAYIAREAASRAPQIAACAQGIEVLSAEVMELIRGMLARLRPHGLETVGLRESLRELIASWEARVAQRFRCSLTMSEEADQLSPELNIALYRLVQECLTNAVRHSHARSLAIRLSADPHSTVQSPPRVRLRLQESGGEPPASAPSGNGMGLLGMRERVEALGGQLTIHAQPDGLTLDAWLPLRSPYREAAGG
ncbi:MAG TPA: histidine kinase [Steroidobacteraceae bacterium]|nr:histidine kinase [Steroidobacteraceae bacterium]